MSDNMLAIHGGIPTRDRKMPARRAFAEDETQSVLTAIEYYRNKDEDPGYQGYFEEKFCKAFTDFMGGGYADAVATGDTETNHGRCFRGSQRTGRIKKCLGKSKQRTDVRQFEDQGRRNGSAIVCLL